MSKVDVSNLNKLYGLAMKPLMEKYASNKYFFTNKEFKEHYGEIMQISGLRWEIEKQLIKNEKT
jgi:hypothetical protein